MAGISTIKNPKAYDDAVAKVYQQFEKDNDTIFFNRGLGKARDLLISETQERLDVLRAEATAAALAELPSSSRDASSVDTKSEPTSLKAKGTLSKSKKKPESDKKKSGIRLRLVVKSLTSEQTANGMTSAPAVKGLPDPNSVRNLQLVLDAKRRARQEHLAMQRQQKRQRSTLNSAPDTSLVKQV